MCTEEWLLDKDKTTSKSLHFSGYDANLYPLRDWTKFKKSDDLHIKRVNMCKQVTKDFNGKVYMDEVCISDIII